VLLAQNERNIYWEITFVWFSVHRKFHLRNYRTDFDEMWFWVLCIESLQAKLTSSIWSNTNIPMHEAKT